MKEAPSWLLKQGHMEDEDLMNVALWASNATKQWCKFDVPGLNKFEMYVKQEGHANIYSDSKFYPDGIPYVFFTAHDAKKPDESYEWLQKLWSGDDDSRKVIHHNGKWFGSAQELHAYDPSLRCMI